MKISITIMAHPKRRQQASRLLAKLSNYPFIQCYITWDEQNDEWHTGERAIRSGVAAGADWHIVLQDDAILSDNFYTNVENALTYVPSKSLVSFYTGQARPLKERVAAAVAKAKYASWLRHYILFWGVCVAIPTDHIEAMLEFCENRREQYDTRLGIFYQENRLPVWYTMPSLVDHDDDLGSLLNHGQDAERRIAHNFVSGPVTWNRDQIDI